MTSGRTLKQLAGDRSRVWRSNRSPFDPSEVPGAKAGPPPPALAALLARKSSRVPDGDDWLHEMEIQGQRLLARIQPGRITLLNARGKPVPAAKARRLAPVANALRMLPVQTAVVDGVLTTLRPDGRTTAQGLEEALRAAAAAPAPSASGALAFFVFDLPYLDTFDLRQAPLEQRKTLLQQLISRAPSAPLLRMATHLVGNGARFFQEACRVGMGGVVSKLRTSAYRPKARRGPPWLVVSCPASRPKRTPKKSASASQQPSVAGITLSHPDRLLYADLQLTKADLARYYEAIAPVMLPHVTDRPLTLVRCPQGAGASGKQACFYMKHAGVWAPKALGRVQIQEKLKVGEYLVINDLAGLISLVQMSVLEVHTWPSTTKQLERPDLIVMDLDPDPTVTWQRVVDAAFDVRQRFEQLGLQSFVKTTGGKGLHVVAPLAPQLPWQQTFAVARAVAERMERDAPDAFTTDMSKRKRVGKIFIDFLRNNRGSTVIAPYSTRARPDATVAVPLTWDELTAELDPSKFRVTTVPARVTRLKGDPWAAAGYFRLRQKLRPSALKSLIG